MNIHKLLFGGSLLLVPFYAWTFTFVPTENEFAAWPDYCKVVYLRTQVGASSDFTQRTNAYQELQANKVLGASTYGEGGVHHYCAGSAWLGRAQLSGKEIEKERLLSNAYNETKFTFDRISRSDPLYVDVHTQMARVLFEQNRLRESIELLGELIATHPTSSIAYTAKSAMHYKLNEFQEAYDTLIEGNKVLEGKSAEVHYNLGLILLKLNKPELAASHGKRAYELGYPLPGLMRKLKVAGVW